MAFAEADDPPVFVVDILDNIGDLVIGSTVLGMVREIAKALGKRLQRSGTGTTSLNQDGDEMSIAGDDGDANYDQEVEMEDYDGADDNNDDDDDDFSEYDDDVDDPYFGLGYPQPQQGRGEMSPRQLILLQRVKRDILKVHEAGYKVGLVDGLGRDSVQGVISISIRASKLGLSEQVMEAWDLDHHEYLVLLIRYGTPYEPLEQVLQMPASQSPARFAIGKCAQHKPSVRQAMAAFPDLNHVDLGQEAAQPEADEDQATFQKVFISNSLDQFMNESFVSLVKLRDLESISWDAANQLLISKVGLGIGLGHGLESVSTPSSAVHGETHTGESLDGPATPQSPDRGTGAPDHLLEVDCEHGRSLPLVAMQFVMRYFMRCTEFCLRCHRKLPDDFEALRPYVCDNPLCLFQYMAMGLGPSIEHEILTQPYVVDLLVSLCYASVHPMGNNRSSRPSASTTQASSYSIRTFPVGLHLQVPHIPDGDDEVGLKVKARISGTAARLTVGSENPAIAGISPASWVAFRPCNKTLDGGQVRHAIVRRVHPAMRDEVEIEVDITGCSAKGWTSSTSYVGPAFASTFGLSATTQTVPASTSNAFDADLFCYDTDFDSMPEDKKGPAMRHVLDTLPSILQIKEYLTSHPHTSLRSMERISPAAASLLQWIVSSNRSCIFQIDQPGHQTHGLAAPSAALVDLAPEEGLVTPLEGEETTNKVTGSQAFNSRPKSRKGRKHSPGRVRDRAAERIPGMEDWVQFKFAQGSREKELRFARALQETATRKELTDYPTIFAWHGSPPANWHSIVRTGLDFEDTRTGRAFGNGVYFSSNLSTSQMYASSSYTSWPNSVLQVSCCLSLNEIINAPDEFVSNYPHFVVSQLDWHQCRYLFVSHRSPARAPVSPSSRAHRLNRTTLGQPGNSIPLPMPTVAEPITPSVSSDDALYHRQAPGLEILGQDEEPIRIPLAAIPRRNVNSSLTRLREEVEEQATRVSTRVSGDESDESDEDLLDVGYLMPDEESGDGGEKIVPRLEKPLVRRPDPIPRLPTPGTPALTGEYATDFRPGTLDLSTLPRLGEPSWATDMATKQLGRDLSALEKVQAKTPLHELGWYIDFESVTNLYQWIVEFHTFEAELPLAQDMKKACVTSIVLEIRFPRAYPFEPPFVRVIRPRFLPFTMGGGGHVTGGGAVCMELLTTSGWSPANSMESVLLQVRLAMCSLEPKPGRLRSVVPSPDPHINSDYTVGEAISAYTRSAEAHGWEVPADFHQTAAGV